MKQATDNNPKTPAFYTDRDGGQWISWTKGPVKKEDIIKAQAIKQGKQTEINGVLVHSILFPTLNPYKFVRWDIINGMTGIVNVK